ncbi:MAG: hypothetical protein R6W95_15920 [Desulfosarcina sp.]
MKEKSPQEQESNTGTRSSVAVSSRTVCQDEACIGKTDAPASAGPPEAGAAKPRKPNPPESSMSFGGETGCQDEACIGKS